MEIKLRFISEHSIGSAAIRFWTWSKYSHVDIVLPEGYLGARKDGVKIRPFDYCKPSRVDMGIIECSDEVANKVIEFAKAQIGKPYDFEAITGIVFHRDWAEDDSWICSELVAAAFQNADDNLIDNKANRVTPQMLIELPRVKLVIDPILKEK